MQPKEKEKEKAAGLKRKKKFLGCSLLEHFELGQKVGVGTFGEVLKAKHSHNGKTVALKKIFTKSEQEGFPITSLREIKLLKNVSHPNVASLIDMAVSFKSHGTEGKEVEDVYMVFPFMDHDLTGILENQEIQLTLPQIKCYMKQLLEGIAYLHQKQIMHRDLKGANLLVNNRGELKITDFGLARPLEENRTKYTPGVVTRWYRPPELLFGSDVYNESLDIWGTGCIIAEMYLRKPLFGASSDLEQLQMLCKYCGTPNEETYPGVSELPDYRKLNLKPEKRILRDYLLGKQIDKEAVDLIDRMLVMDPKQRISASEALEHEYFKCDPLPCLPSEIAAFQSSHVYTVSQQKENEAKKRKIESNRVNRERDANRQSHSSHGALPPPPPPPPPPVDSVRNRHNAVDYDRRSSLDYGHRDRSDRRRDLDYDHDRRHHEVERSNSGHHDREHRDREHHEHRDHRGHVHQHNHRDQHDHHDTRDQLDHRDTREHARRVIRSESENHLNAPSRSNSRPDSHSRSRSRSRSRSPPRRRADPSESSSLRSRRTISYEDL